MKIWIVESKSNKYPALDSNFNKKSNSIFAISHKYIPITTRSVLDEIPVLVSRQVNDPASAVHILAIFKSVYLVRSSIVYLSPKLELTSFPTDTSCCRLAVGAKKCHSVGALLATLHVSTQLLPAFTTTLFGCVRISWMSVKDDVVEFVVNQFAISLRKQQNRLNSICCPITYCILPGTHLQYPNCFIQTIDVFIMYRPVYSQATNKTICNKRPFETEQKMAVVLIK